MPELNVTTIDLVILGVYIFGVRVAIGLYVSWKTRGAGTEEYFLAGRNLIWPIVGLSFYVSQMGGATFVGLAGAGYANGVAVFNYEWMPVLILIFFGFFVLPFYMRARVFTAPQFLGERYGRNSKLALSGFTIFVSIFIDAASGLYGVGVVFKTLFPNIPLWVIVAAAAAIAGAYIFVGGLEAVVLNDVLQASLVFVGATVVAVLTFLAIPSWEAVKEANPESAFHLILPPSSDYLPWPGIITGVFVIGLYYWCFNQYVVQRALAARDLDHGRWGPLLAALLKLPNLFILIIAGLMATVLYPNLNNPDLVFPTLAFDLLPIGLRGLLLAAIAAALLSTLESMLNSASTLFTMDFVRTFRPDTSDRRLTNIGRAATIGFVVLAAVWAPQVSSFPTLWQYLQSALSYLTPPIVAVFVLGIFWRRANGYGAFTALIVGVPLGVVGFILNEVIGVFQIQFLYASGIMFAMSCLILAAVSLATPAPSEEEVKDYTWRREFWREESEELENKPWYKNYRYLTLGLILITAPIVIWWW